MDRWLILFMTWVLVVVVVVDAGDVKTKVECVRSTKKRGYCVVEPLCISGFTVLWPNETVVTCKDLYDVVENFDGNCTAVLEGVQSLYSNGVLPMSLREIVDRGNLHSATYFFPSYLWTHNVYHYGRAFIMLLQTMWHSSEYADSPPRNLLFMHPGEGYRRQGWNKAMTDIAVQEMNLTVMFPPKTPTDSSELMCFEKAILMGKDDGLIFGSGLNQKVQRDVHMSTHIPFVPLASLRFRQLIQSSSESPFRFHRAMKIQLPSPPAVITMNHRGGVKEKRGFSPEGFKRFNAMLSRIATEHNLEFRIATFEHQSFEQQIRIMQSSGIVVGLHGANMMNAIFLPPLSSLLEIFPVFYYPDCYIAGGNSGLQYSSVAGDDENVKWCDQVDILCQEYLRSRIIYLSERKWEELEYRLNATMIYINTLRKMNTVTLHLVGDNYHLTRRDKKQIIREWQARGYGSMSAYLDAGEML